MIAPRHLTLIAPLILCLCAPAHADLPPEKDWNLVRDEDGIRIYTQPMPNSAFEAFKAVTVLEAPLTDVTAVMANPGSCVDWVHGCTFSEGLDGDSDGLTDSDFNDRRVYSVNDLPWPAEDRDYVLRIRTRTLSGSGIAAAAAVIVMELNAIADQRRSAPGIVRVAHSDTLYALYAVDEGRTHMTWVQHTEPNGALPSWLVNSLAIDIPFNSVQRLEKLANSAAYGNHELILDDREQLIGVQRRAAPQVLTGTHVGPGSPSSQPQQR